MTALNLPFFSLSPSPHITQVGEHLLTLPQQLEPFSSSTSAAALFPSSPMRYIVYIYIYMCIRIYMDLYLCPTQKHTLSVTITTKIHTPLCMGIIQKKVTMFGTDSITIFYSSLVHPTQVFHPLSSSKTTGMVAPLSLSLSFSL